ncbi:MAG: winged helix-turn-helix domain-containing protein [bacterium]|nr:winged helix-turn-helix domain-containing protein [bacterium]
MSSQHTLSLETARTLAVVKQGLHQRPAMADKQTLLESIQNIGLLQLDTVSVVARSHYLVMLSRMGLYDPADLDALLHPDRRLFEQWAHAACLIPVEDYHYFAPVIHARREQPRWHLHRLGKNPQEVLDTVLAEVTQRGPLASKDFEDSENGSGKRTWWNWKPAKAALDILYSQGHLMIDRRVKFQMYYDLAERVLPASADPLSKTIEEWQRWTILRSISCLGVATAEQAGDYYRHKIPLTRATLESVADEGAVIPVAVQGWEKPAYLHVADLPLLEAIRQGACQPTLTTFLSPFDNLTWNRQRLEELFDFEYRIEMYTPKAKRKYGYYVMPILHNGRFVGRIDPKAERKTGTLIVQAIYLEPEQEVSDELLDGLIGALKEFMAFHGSQKLSIEQSAPKTLKKALLDRLKS